MVLCLRSGLVGLVVAAGTLGLEMGSLSFCFRLLSLSEATGAVRGAPAERRRQEEEAFSPVSPGFPTMLGFLLSGMDARAGEPVTNRRSAGGVQMLVSEGHKDAPETEASPEAAERQPTPAHTQAV